MVDPRFSKITVDELGKKWLGSNPSKRPTTKGTDEIGLTVHIPSELNSRTIGSMTPSDVQTLVNRWGETLAPRTVLRWYGVLRAIFAFAVENDWIGRTPCRGVKLPAVTSTRRHTLMPTDVASIAAATSPRYRAMIWIGAVLGLRWSEVAGLRVGNVDLLRRVLTVAETVTRDAQGRPIHSKTTRSQASKRILAIPEALADLLSEHMARNGLNAVNQDRFLFEAPAGGPLRYSNWRARVWLPAITTAGHAGAGFHDLRRTNATIMVAENVDMKTAQLRLGHSDPRLTLALYAQAVEGADRRAAETLGERFFGNSKPVARDGRAMGDPKKRRKANKKPA